MAGATGGLTSSDRECSLSEPCRRLRERSAMTLDEYDPSVSAVTLMVVGDEMEAEAVCGLLRTNGIESAYRRTDRSAAVGTYGGGFAIAGPTEVLVDEGDLDVARKLLKTIGRSAGPTFRSVERSVPEAQRGGERDEQRTGGT
jgi:hypothetical protein